MTPRVRPVRIIPINERTRVRHIAPGFEPYFGETAAGADVDFEETTGRWRTVAELTEGDWT